MLGYAELAGFLFALGCMPEFVMPSEWLPRVLGKEPGDSWCSSPTRAARELRKRGADQDARQ